MLELSVTGDSTQFGFGGDTLNTAAYLARELRHSDAKVQFVSALGTDPMSEDMLDAWNREGIDTSQVLRIDDALPGLYLIRTDAIGERNFFYWREQAAVRRLFDGDGMGRLSDALAGCRLLYLSGITLAIFTDARRDALLELLRTLRNSGTSIAFDTNYRPRLWSDIEQARTAYASIGPLVDIALAGLDDEQALDTEVSPAGVLRRWQSLGARESVVRCAADGAYVASDGEPTEVPVSELREPVDTTAAGDSFNAAYLAARLRGVDMVAATQAAHALAGRVIMHSGAIVPADISHPMRLSTSCQ